MAFKQDPLYRQLKNKLLACKTYEDLLALQVEVHRYESKQRMLAHMQAIGAAR